MAITKGDNNRDKNLESTRGIRYQKPLCDIYESDNEYTIYFDLPGVEKSDIDLKVEKDILTLTAECSKQAGEGYSCIREEMDYAGFRRSFNLNKTVDSTKISADYNEGSLKLSLPKKEEQKSKQIEIKVG